MAVTSSEFAETCLKEHNRYRSLHNAPPLVLEQKLNDFALEWATELATSNKFEHRANNPYGENLYSAFNSDLHWKLKAEDAVKSWYDEITLYKFGKSTPENLSEVGHFTQLVWMNTRSLGVGLASSQKGNTYVVCNYEPAGNVLGEFETNVLPLQHSKTNEDDSKSEKEDRASNSKKVLLQLPNNENSEFRLVHPNEYLAEELLGTLSPEERRIWTAWLMKIGDVANEWQQWLHSHINLALRIGECIREAKADKNKGEKTEESNSAVVGEREHGGDKLDKGTEFVIQDMSLEGMPGTGEIGPTEIDSAANLKTKTAVEDNAQKGKDNFINVQRKVIPDAAIDRGEEKHGENFQQSMKFAEDEEMHIESKERGTVFLPVPSSEEDMIKLIRQVVHQAAIYRAMYKQWVTSVEKTMKKLVERATLTEETADTCEESPIFVNLKFDLDIDVGIDYEEFPLLDSALEKITRNNAHLYFNLTDKPMTSEEKIE